MDTHYEARGLAFLLRSLPLPDGIQPIRGRFNAIPINAGPIGAVMRWCPAPRRLGPEMRRLTGGFEPQQPFFRSQGRDAIFAIEDGLPGGIIAIASDDM